MSHSLSQLVSWKIQNDSEFSVSYSINANKISERAQIRLYWASNFFATSSRQVTLTPLWWCVTVNYSVTPIKHTVCKNISQIWYFPVPHDFHIYQLHTFIKKMGCWTIWWYIYIYIYIYTKFAASWWIIQEQLAAYFKSSTISINIHFA